MVDDWDNPRPPPARNEMWTCAGCGKPSPDRVRSCDCPTSVVCLNGGKYAWKLPHLRVRGVGRVADEPRALLVLLTEVPTDDDLRSMHEHLRDWDATVMAKDGGNAR